MTTEEIASLADPEKVAAPDFPVQTVLRRKVIPEFFRRVGFVGWRRYTEQIPVEAGVMFRDINTHFREIQAVICEGTPLTFIGDDPLEMSLVSNENPPAMPGKYFLSFNAGDLVQPGAVIEGVGVRRLNFAAPALRLTNITVSGWRTPRTEDLITVFDLDPFIPLEWQWGLVEGLAAAIFRSRLGVEDPRTVTASGEYERIIAEASDIRETTLDETPRYA
jgi:hypothetical protein